MRIRIASESDIPEMHRIRMSVRENRLLDPAMVQPDDYRPILAERGRGWIAERDGRLLGFAVADRSRSNVWALFVDPECQSRGVGRALHDTMMSWLFAEGADQVWLTTDPGTRAAGFYEAAGWRYAGTRHGEALYELSRREWLTRSQGGIRA